MAFGQTLVTHGVRHRHLQGRFAPEGRNEGRNGDGLKDGQASGWSG